MSFHSLFASRFAGLGLGLAITVELRLISLGSSGIDGCAALTSYIRMFISLKELIVLYIFDYLVYGIARANYPDPYINCDRF
jgi:hypothetical protein